jgi:hypothetical protein
MDDGIGLAVNLHGVIFPSLAIVKPPHVEIAIVGGLLLIPIGKRYVFPLIYSPFISNSLTL